MKKGIIVLLIAVLVSGFAFADLSGSAGVLFDADLSAKTAGFENNKGLTFTFTFDSESVEVGGEDVHVEVEASAEFILGKIDPKNDTEYKFGEKIKADGPISNRGIGIVAKISTAKIVGSNWYVSVLGAADAADYAKAAVLEVKTKKDKDDFGNLIKYKNEASSYAVEYDKYDGVTVGFAGFTVSGSLKIGTPEVGRGGSATIETPEFAFSDDAIKFQAAAEISNKTNVGYYNAGASVKGTVAIEDIKVGVAADFGLEELFAKVETVKPKFNMDARADFSYKFVEVNVYTYVGPKGLKYGEDDKYDKFYLEAKAAFDLNEFEVPLEVTLKGKNLVDKNEAGIDLGAEVEFAKDAITAAASFDINLKTKEISSLVYGTYAFEKFTAGAGVTLAGTEKVESLKLAAFAETDKLVEGATFGVNYGLKTGDVYSDGSVKTIADDGKYTADFLNKKAGTIGAYCKIAF